MWLGQVPWAGRYWALPFLTVLAPSARYHRQRGQKAHRLGPADDHGTPLMVSLPNHAGFRSAGAGGRRQLRRPRPHCCQSLANPLLIARLRLDAALYEPAPARQPGRNGRPPLKGRRLPALKRSWTCPPCMGRGVGSLVQLPAGLTSQTAVCAPSRPCCAGSWFGNRWLNPLPSSPACAWTPPFMNRRQHVSRAGTVGLR